MSTFVPSTIICTCGEHYVAEVANGLHISARPDIRQQILDGTFHRFYCPSCGAPTSVDKMLAYTDFPNRHWFTVAPRHGIRWRREWIAFANESFEKTMVNNAPPMVVQWGTEMMRRLVFGLASLREKLVITSAGLDDRIIELLKLQLIRDLHERFSAEDFFHLVSVKDTQLCFERTHPDGLIRSFEVPRAMYIELAAHAELPTLIATTFPNGIVVDYRAMLAPDPSTPASRAENTTR